MKKIILSLEQALALPYATQRFAQLGWRVIRIEMPSKEGNGNAGDPNRYIGTDLGYHDLHAYYIAPNIGKEAITLNLKTEDGQALLLKIIRDLKVDVFMCNTLPKRYEQLGIGFQNLVQANPDLIWCGISALGPEYPERAGYDPALQALLGYTWLTGEKDGTPVPCGIPIIDLKAGDEAFTQVLLAMLEQQNNAGGKEIHISMAQCAASWLITALPQLAFVKDDKDLHMRSGNEHRSFIPCNAYPTKDGFVYLAIGNDLQWQKFTAQHGFCHLANEQRKTNAGRMEDKENIYKEIGEITKTYTTTEFVDQCLSINLSVAPVNSIKEVANLDFINKYMMKTRLPNGMEARLSPPSHNSEYLEAHDFEMTCAPRLGAQNNEIYKQIGFSDEGIKELKKKQLI